MDMCAGMVYIFIFSIFVKICVQAGDHVLYRFFVNAGEQPGLLQDWDKMVQRDSSLL